MNLEIFRQLALESYVTHEKIAQDLEDEDGSVGQDNLITYIHELAVASAIAEIAKAIIAAADTPAKAVRPQGVTLQ